MTVARNPRRLILLRQSKGKFCLPSRSATPITVKQSSKGSTLMTKYDVLFEETLVLRLQDMQFSDHISLELWVRHALIVTFILQLVHAISVITCHISTHLSVSC